MTDPTPTPPGPTPPGPPPTPPDPTPPDPTPADRLAAAVGALARDWLDLVVAACDLWKPVDPGGGGGGTILHPETACVPAYAGPQAVRVGVSTTSGAAPPPPLEPAAVSQLVAGQPAAPVSPAATGLTAAPAGADAVVVELGPTGAARATPPPARLFLGDVVDATGQRLAPFVLYLDGLV